MGIFNDLAGLAGENYRIKANANNVDKLDSQTRQWLEGVFQRADNGDMEAMFEIACYYINGNYVGYNPHEACYWWTQAANKGHILSQYNLGLLYHGEVSYLYYDPNLAGYWFYWAAQNGNADANQMLGYYKFSSFSNKWVRR